VDHVESVVMDRPLTKVPGALVQLWLLDQFEDPAVPLIGADLELMVGSVGGEQLTAHPLGDEEAHLPDLTHRGRRPKRSTDRILARNTGALVRLTVVASRVCDQRVLDPTGVAEADPFSAE